MDWLASPPVALAFFLGVTYGLYRLAGRYATGGKETPGKRLPYACGEDIVPGETKLSYEGFFRLALMFVVTYVGTLVLATMPRAEGLRELATLYLLGVAICVDVLARKEG
jgi:NADH:ubiquinone oxidoreductase subunit 3 (subunit A)